ncbi:MAG TPA: ribosome biogenesis GTP-binding protein YihA/YsxC [Longimicrobiales bacterium]
MKIKSVEFAGAIGRPDQAPPGRLPQVAFSGRSNVGKSSLINRVLGRTRTPLARVSATPGKTQEINFYRVRAEAAGGHDIEFFLVDLPGYGYARAPQELRRRWKPLIEGYLTGSRELVGVVQLIDARHGPTATDREMLVFLASLGVPALFVLTKADKLSRGERARQAEKLARALEADPEQVVLFSSRTGEGREELLAALDGLLGKDGEGS